MSEATSAGTRYTALPIFLILAAFSLFAPDFWRHVELHPAESVAAYENSDLYHYIYPAYHHGFGRLKAGELPLWNAGQLGGAPFLADPQNAVYQPLNLLFIVLPTSTAMAVHAFLCIVLMGWFFSLFARSLGIGWMPAVLGGATYAFSGASAAAMSRPSSAALLACMPLVFWMVNGFSRSRRPSSAVAAGLALGVAALSGAYLMLIAFLLMLVPYTVLASLKPRRDTGERAGSRLVGWIVLSGVAAGIAAVQLMPTLFWLSTLADPWARVAKLDLAAAEPVKAFALLTQFLVPTPGNLPRLNYIGILPLLLSPLALFHWRRFPVAVFFTASAAVALFLFLFGEENWGWPFRVAVFPLTFAVSTVASLGADRLLRPRNVQRRQVVWHLVFLVLIVGGAIFYVSSAMVRGYVIAALIIVLLFSVFRSRAAVVVAALLLVGLQLVDLRGAHANLFAHPFQNAPACYATHDAAFDAALTHAHGDRCITAPDGLNVDLSPNLGMVTSLRMAGGTGIPLSVHQAAWWRALTGEAAQQGTLSLSRRILGPESPNPVLLNDMAVRVILADQRNPMSRGAWAGGGPQLNLAPESAQTRILINNDALPRCYWTPRARIAASDEDAYATLSDPAFDRRSACVAAAETLGNTRIPVMEQGGTASADDQPSDVLTTGQSTCLVEEDTPERVRIRVTAPEEGVLVLADTYAPYWRARVNGENRPIARVNGMFRGVVVPQGDSVVEFTYRPWPVWLGMGISGFTLFALAVALIRRVFRRA